jgi:hypothetical protein
VMATNVTNRIANEGRSGIASTHDTFATASATGGVISSGIATYSAVSVRDERGQTRLHSGRMEALFY